VTPPTLKELMAEREEMVKAGVAPRALAEREAAVPPPTVFVPVLDIDDKTGLKTTEFWLALAMPFVVALIVGMGWLSEDAATQLGVTSAGTYVLGKSLVKVFRNKNAGAK
jgi:hypothetical protein